jgi:hypothetical protein
MVDHWLISATSGSGFGLMDPELRGFVGLDVRHTDCLDRVAGTSTKEELRMLITNPGAEWARDHVPADELGRAVSCEKRGSTRAALGSPAHEVQVSRGPVVSARPEPLGTAGGLARILATMVHQAYVGPGEQERARANADRLLETIRVLSIL